MMGAAEITKLIASQNQCFFNLLQEYIKLKIVLIKLHDFEL